jgi:hypothetical protein
MVIGHGEGGIFVKFFCFSVGRFPRYGSLNFGRGGRGRDGRAVVGCLYLGFCGTWRVDFGVILELLWGSMFLKWLQLGIG